MWACVVIKTDMLRYTQYRWPQSFKMVKWQGCTDELWLLFKSIHDTWAWFNSQNIVNQILLKKNYDWNDFYISDCVQLNVRFNIVKLIL